MLITLLLQRAKSGEMKIVKKNNTKKDLSLISLLKNWGGRTRTSEMAVPKTAALPLGDTPLLGTFLLYILKINCQ